MLIGFDRSSQSRPRIQVLWFRTLSRLNWDERFLGLGHLEAEMIRQISRRGSYETIQPYGADSQHGYIYESEGSHSERRWRMPSLRLRLWGWLLDRSIETMVLSYIINYEARGVNSTGWIVKRNVKNDRAMVIFFSSSSSSSSSSFFSFRSPPSPSLPPPPLRLASLSFYFREDWCRYRSFASHMEHNQTAYCTLGKGSTHWIESIRWLHQLMHSVTCLHTALSLSLSLPFSLFLFPWLINRVSTHICGYVTQVWAPWSL